MYSYCPAPALAVALRDMHDPNESCLYVAIDAPRERHDDLLRDLVAPAIREIRNDPNLDSLFVVRYADPTWQLRFRVLGRPAWIRDEVRPRVERALEPFRDRGAIGSVAFGEYRREWERYGGPVGMRLAERIFTHDTHACLDLLDAETRHACARSRREWSLAFVEGFLDLLELNDAQRAAFYRAAHEWAFREGIFAESDRDALDKRYRALRPGLESLRAARTRDAALAYGGDAPAAIAHACLEASRPLIAEVRRGCADGSITSELGQLAWSYTHMHCNRLGLDLPAEAILRYVMFRFYEDESRAEVTGA